MGIYKPDFVLAFFILIWINDTFAYLTGMYIGKNKFFPRISPKKTWEGFVGGLVFSLGVAYLFYDTDFVTINHFTITDWLFLGAIVSIFGVFGDLIESMFKRSLEVKDSGDMLPGHGGILDRFDSVFLAAPMYFAYYELIIS